MCFSAGADLTAGLVVGAVAVDGLRHVRRPEELPLALVPAVFSIHHLTEVLVWWGLQGHLSAALGERSAVFYLLVAFGVLPPLVPMAIGAVEPSRRRRLPLGVLALVGTAVAATLISATVDGDIGTRIDGHHLVYNVGLTADFAVTSGYVLATCGAMLVSSHRTIRRYGLVNLPVVGLLAWVQQNAVVSLWCLWAAITSVLVVVQLRRGLGVVGRVGLEPTTQGL